MMGSLLEPWVITSLFHKFQAYAQDFTGDGKRNVWDPLDPSDALASTANYLAEFGWTNNQPWGIEVNLPENFNYRNADLEVKATPARWSELGLKTITGGKIPIMVKVLYFYLRVQRVQLLLFLIIFL
jgi:membrane-bound lytic murein transglycosylase B